MATRVSMGGKRRSQRRQAALSKQRPCLPLWVLESTPLAGYPGQPLCPSPEAQREAEDLPS